MECPACGSKNTQKSSAVHEQGSATSSSRTKGFGASSGGRLSLFDASSTSERVTAAAAKNAPPAIDAMSMTGLIMLAVVGGLILGVLVEGSILGLLFPGFLIAMGLAIAAMIYSLWNGPSEAQREAEEKYLRQWYCKKCGDLFFVRAAPQQGPAPTNRGWFSRTLRP